MNDVIAFLFGMLAGIGAIALVVFYYIVKILRSIKLEEQQKAIVVKENEMLKQVAKKLISQNTHKKGLKLKDNTKKA